MSKTIKSSNVYSKLIAEELEQDKTDIGDAYTVVTKKMLPMNALIHATEIIHFMNPDLPIERKFTRTQAIIENLNKEYNNEDTSEERKFEIKLELNDQLKKLRSYNAQSKQKPIITHKNSKFRVKGREVNERIPDKKRKVKSKLFNKPVKRTYVHLLEKIA